MKLKERLRLLACVLALPMAFVACDSNDYQEEYPIFVEKGVYVFNSGNQGKSIEGSLSFIDEKTETVTNDVFKIANNRSLGSTVQDGVVLGNNLFVAVYESNTIEVVNKNTLVSIAQIRPTAAQGKGPRDIVTDGKNIYVSMFSGHVLRIDPSTNTIDKTIQVGPNPEEMVVANGFLYVVNSDGMNYNAGYANGKSVSKIALSTFTEEKKIAVGMNPTKIAADASGNVFALCMGDYGAVPSSLWKINSKDEAEEWKVTGTLMATKGNSIYVIDSPWGATATAMKYVVYNTLTGEMVKDNFVSTPADAAVGLAIDPVTEHIFITSYNLVGGFASADTPGYVNEYSADGTFIKKFDVGVGAVYMAFLK